MSIVALAVRVAAVRAITGRTLAGGRVFDSAILPIDEVLAEHRQPIIVVTTDDSAAENIGGRELIGGDRRLDLVVEIAIASGVRVPVGQDDDGEELSIVVPHTDAGTEQAINVIERQITRALMDSKTVWGALFMGLVPQIGTITSRRGAGAQKGIRFAARQIVFTCEPIHEPVFGAPVGAGSPVAAFLTATTADAELSALSTLLAAEIAGEPLTDWDRARVAFGLTDDEARAIGIEPFILAADIVSDPDEPDVVPIADIEMTGYGEDMPITEQLAEEQLPEATP